MRYDDGMLPLLLFLGLSAGILQRPVDVVKWSAIAPAAVKPGATVQVSLTARVANGWKLYALVQPQGGPRPLDIKVAEGAPFTIARKQIGGPKPKTLQDENFDMETLYYEREAIFTVPVTLSKSVSGTAVIPLDVTYQACGDSICLRPFTERVNVLVMVNR